MGRGYPIHRTTPRKLDANQVRFIRKSRVYGDKENWMTYRAIQTVLTKQGTRISIPVIGEVAHGRIYHDVPDSAEEILKLEGDDR